ncbi:glycosyltransferase [Bordetella genomosp. 11]|uniref:Glycosyl transferase n=1 Tax=Bordetella genomosp. 11 TaxID=1416808 RepID=A0A261UFB2_9BORD|nr:glycosyltransferase [Bordetella genomosp. 11]OZI60628.1 glycosyl transferase [Bordetella genomosp. 11]
MIGVCIPAHNEEDTVQACLASIRKACMHPGLKGERVVAVLVLDSCTDRTAEYAGPSRVAQLRVACRNVGQARAVGADYLIAAGARWLAFTDADTTVSTSWLADQLSLQAAAVCGTVGVADWTGHGRHAHEAKWHFQSAYRDRDGHRHIHGANLGIASDAYLRAGGFRALACHEDRDLVERLERAGETIAWSALPRVSTSARPYSRVAEGFAAALREGWDSDEKAA